MHGEATYDIAMVGAGRVGQSLGRLLAQAGHRLTLVSCRTLPRAERAVAFIQSGQPVAHADFPRLAAHPQQTVVFLTTPDDALVTTAGDLAKRQEQWEGITVFHCSGALSSAALHALRQRGARVGSMHPLHAFGEATVKRQELAGVHWTIEGDATANSVARRLITALDGQVHEIQPEHKVLYHAAASLAGNHLTGLLSLSFTLLERCGIAPLQARAMLVQLSAGLLQRVQAEGEVAALAGPIVRGDAGIVAQHLEALRDLPPIYRRVYCSLGTELVTLARQKGTSATALAEIMRLLQP